MAERTEIPFDDPEVGLTYRALAAIAGTARDRCGEVSGFDCLLCFVKYDQLVEHAEGYPGSLFATYNEHRQFAATYLRDETNRERVIAFVLNTASRQSGDGADLANRIFDRMARTDAGWAGAKPQFYALPTADGLAVALAIYDTFWTERW